MTVAAAPAGAERAGAVRLLDAAERLLATKGPAATVREITTAAGHLNSSAVAYYFGGRQGLLDAVWQRRTLATNTRRAQMLAEIERSGQTDDPAALVRAHVLPIVEQMARQHPSYWARFKETRLAELPLDFTDALERDLERFPGEVPLHVLLRLFGYLRAHVAKDRPVVAGRRVAVFSRFVISCLAAWERDAEAGRLAPDTLPAFADDVMRMALAALEAPTV